MAIANGTGTFTPYSGSNTTGDRSSYTINNKGHIYHQIDLNVQNIDPHEYIKWCRRNLGERGNTWEFWLAGGLLYIEVWGDKAKFTYEMWKN
jgi:hypothetical protein